MRILITTFEVDSFGETQSVGMVITDIINFDNKHINIMEE